MAQKCTTKENVAALRFRNLIVTPPLLKRCSISLSMSKLIETRFMKVLLQNIDTKLYLGRGGNWIGKPDAALAFLDEVRARDYSVYRRLAQVRVVVRAEPALAETIPAALTVAAADETHFYSESLSIARERTNQAKMEIQMKANRTKLTKEPLMANQMAETVGGKTAHPSGESRRRRKAAPAPPALLTMVKARVDVGHGNTLFIRGQGDGLSWEKGRPLDCVDAVTWIWSTRKAKDKVQFKLLLNDQIWAKGGDLEVEAGAEIEITPAF
jgi:hypothetical protein